MKVPDDAIAPIADLIAQIGLQKDVVYELSEIGRALVSSINIPRMLVSPSSRGTWRGRSCGLQQVMHCYERSPLDVFHGHLISSRWLEET